MSSFRALILASCLLVACVSVLTGATFTLDNWSSPSSQTQLSYVANSAPTAVDFNNQVWIAYSQNGQGVSGAIHYTSSVVGDGSRFNTAIQSLPSYVSYYDPELVTVYDVGTSQMALVLLYADLNFQLQYGVLDPSTGLFPSSPIAVSGILSNVKGDIDAISIVSSDSASNPSKLCFVYVSTTDVGDAYYAAYAGCGQLTNGVFAATANPVGGSSPVSWQLGSEAAVFYVPPYGMGFMQAGSGGGFVFTSQTPEDGPSYLAEGALKYPGLIKESQYSGFNAVQFSLAAACTDLIGVFFIPPSGGGLGLGYVILAPNNVTTPVVGGARQTVSTVTSSAVNQPVVAYLPSAQTLYVYYIDTTNPSNPVITLVSTQPSLV